MTSADLQRRLYWQALQPYVRQFASAGGQIIHAHSSALTGCMAGRMGSAKLVVSMLDNELFDVAPASPGWRRAIVDTLRRADAVVYLSPLLMRLGIEAAGPHRACVIPLAIDVYTDLPAQRPPDFTISTAARLIVRKQIHVLIAAFAEFHREVPAARLIVIGDGDERPRLEKLAAQSGVKAAVQFTGNLSHREVATRIAGSHVFMLPSVRESLGTVYFEAMSQGVPVVSTRGEGFADFIEDGKDGFLVPPDDAGSLLRLMQLMYAQPELRVRVAEAGRSRFERSKVRWTDSVSAHLELFEQLARSRN